MISVLIPVFNKNVLELIQELSRQLQDNNLEGEIIAYDDASEMSYKQINRQVASLYSVRYDESEKNLGRIEMRRLLA